MLVNKGQRLVIGIRSFEDERNILAELLLSSFNALTCLVASVYNEDHGVMEYTARLWEGKMSTGRQIRLTSLASCAG